MSSHPARRSFRPALETLEGREVPSTLLGNLQTIQNDLNIATNAFITDQAVLAGFQSPAPSGGSQQVATQLSQTTADYQRMVNDNFSIQKTGAQDIMTINLVALATGNPAIIGAAFFLIDPQFTTLMAQSSITLGNVSAQANQTYNFVGTLGVQPSIASQVQTP
jgi:hypothetical protein